MSKTILDNINNIPVRTWRWLRVNDLSIDSELPSKKPYNLNIFEKNCDKTTVLPMDAEKNSLKLLSAFDYEGLSNELTESVKNDYNTGFYIETLPDQKILEPIIIHYDFDTDHNRVTDNNIIIAEEGSEITVLVKYTSGEETEAFHNGLTRIYCKKNATVNIVKVQTLSEHSTHLDACIAKLEDNATVNYILVELGAKNSITNVRTDLEGFRSSVSMGTVYIGDKTKTIDINYLANHYGKETKSNIDVKGALMDHANKVFKGTIDFKKGASKSKGQEEEYVVLLSKEVRNRSVPLLLCTEDDVQGQHAASSGKIDENKLFYLMTRGISEMEAKRLIIEASISPIVDRVPDRKTKLEIYGELRRKLIYEK